MLRFLFLFFFFDRAFNRTSVLVARSFIATHGCFLFNLYINITVGDCRSDLQEFSSWVRCILLTWGCKEVFVMVGTAL